VARLAHVSGIGSDPASSSHYIRRRGEGELAVRAAFADATLIRPAVMFGSDDSFLTTILGLLGRLPVYPMFGRGLTRLQPSYVEDVAEAVARVLQRTEMHAVTVECGGPRVYTYERCQSQRNYEFAMDRSHAARRRLDRLPGRIRLCEDLRIRHGQGSLDRSHVP